MLQPWYTGKFIDIQAVNETTWRFWVQIPELEHIDFVPGQFMTFDLPIHKRRHKRWRSYSISSAPDGTNVLEFVIVHLEGGLGSTYLFNEVKIGTSLKLRGPLGKFVLPESLDTSREICFVCTGTGIAPFRSMLLHMRQQQLPRPKMNLIFGTRYENGLLYREEMIELAQIWPDFAYHPTLSRDEDWTGPKGYVHPIYEQLYADRRPASFYLCGWNVMLDEARQRLAAMGYDRKSIQFESYG